MSTPYIVGNPTSCSEAVRVLDDCLGEDWKEVLMKTKKKDLNNRHFDLGMLIRNGLNLHHNQELQESCGENNADDASMVIIQALWEHLHKNYTIYKDGSYDNGIVIRKGHV